MRIGNRNKKGEANTPTSLLWRCCQYVEREGSEGLIGGVVVVERRASVMHVAEDVVVVGGVELL